MVESMKEDTALPAIFNVLSVFFFTIKIFQ